MRTEGIMNSDHIFPCASRIFACDWKGEKCPGKFGMCPDAHTF